MIERHRRPASAATPPTRSNDATDLMIPNVASCRDCHGGETTRLPVPSSCAMCHDYHMDEGVPSQLLRQQVRGAALDDDRGPRRSRSSRRAGGRPRTR